MFNKENVMKKRLCLVMAVLLMLSMTACGRSDEAGSATQDTQEEIQASEADTASGSAEEETPAQSEDDEEDFRIGIVTGSFSQSEDDRRGAEAFQNKYGSDKVTLAIYPDNFTDEFETTVGIITGLADDPKIKAIIVNQAVEGTDVAFRRI